ncbi:MAG: lysophospholipid acyltransferase family protein [Kiritimatiellae bacterium]|nr:lysophospholipid acyltransferase family protein [Kiritimatiellia bacterium]
MPRAVTYWFGLRIADRFYAHKEHDRRAVMSNLRQIFSARGMTPTDEHLQSVARKTFQYFGKYLVDFFRYARLTRREVDRLVSVEHPEYIEQARARGKGVICLSAHIGNWELAAAVMGALGYEPNAVVLPERLDKLDKLFQHQRRKRGMKLIPLGHAAMGLVRCLRRGEFVALVADRDFSTRDDRTVFFGKPARLPHGPARLSIMTGAPILPTFLLREVDDTFLLRMYPPIFPEELGSEEAIRRRIVEILEDVIGEFPYQWFIFDDFWADADRAEVVKRTSLRKENGHATRG